MYSFAALGLRCGHLINFTMPFVIIKIYDYDYEPPDKLKPLKSFTEIEGVLCCPKEIVLVHVLISSPRKDFVVVT